MPNHYIGTDGDPDNPNFTAPDNRDWDVFGDDRINYVYLNGGDDFYRDTHQPPDYVWGGAGDDLVQLGRGEVRGEGGNDLLMVAEKAWGGSGNDTIDNRLPPGSYIWSKTFDCLAYGGSGHDLIYGSVRNNTFYGQSGNDTLIGNNNRDYLDGGANNDYLYGYAGNDTLVGGGGNDTLVGAELRDTITGGAGADDFVTFTNVNGQQDVITDFENGVDVIGYESYLNIDWYYDSAINRTVVLDPNQSLYVVLIDGNQMATLDSSDFYAY